MSARRRDDLGMWLIIVGVRDPVAGGLTANSEPVVVNAPLTIQYRIQLGTHTS